MRKIIRTKAFQDFYESLNARTKKKVKYIMTTVEIEQNVSSKLIKKMINTEFYEMRISTDNEYRTIIFTMDNENFANATTILLLNGFMKKSTNDYQPQITKARKIMEEEEYGKD